MAKGRVKLEEFTVNDRINLLDLFVNNEKTLMQVHDSLFPKPTKVVYQNNSHFNSEAQNITMLETSSNFESNADLDAINIKPFANDGKKAYATIDKSLDQIKGSDKKRLPAIQTPTQQVRSDAGLFYDHQKN